MQDLRDRVVVVTGAGSGIGRATALAFAAEGARVHCVDIRGDRAEDVANTIRGTGARAVPHTVDVTDASAVEALAGRIFEADGRVDVLHNNAGVALGKPFDDTPLSDWQWIVNVNLWGVVHGCHAFIPRMLPQGEGVVINTASILGLVAVPNASAYTATKFAVVGLSEALDLEYKDRGIRVLALCPGLVATNIIEDGRVGVPGDAEGRKMAAGFTKNGVSPDVIAADVIRGVKATTPVILTPGHAKAIAAARSYAPSVARWLVGRLTRRKTV